MKLKYKKYLYIFAYISFIVILCLLNILSVMNKSIMNLPLFTNPFIFILLDIIFLRSLMVRLMKEPYKLQKRLIIYFKTWNNLILFSIILISANYIIEFPSDSIFVSFIDALLNILVVIALAPIPQDPEQINGVEEFFNKYPERAKHKFYKNIDEIKKEYNSLKQEVEIEIPVMEVKYRDQKKEKFKKMFSYVAPVLIVVIVIVSMFYSIVEIQKTFNRGNYHHFEAELNKEIIPVYYDQEFRKIIIPFLYTQYGYNDSNRAFNIDYDYIMRDVPISYEYILDVKDYICYDGSIRVQCTPHNYSSHKETALPSSEMMIQHGNYIDEVINRNIISNEEKDVIYKGVYERDVTKYIQETGIYVFTITNESDNIKNELKIIINVVEEKTDN